MEIKYDKNFVRDIRKLKNPVVAADIKKVIDTAEQASNIYEIKNIKKMEGFTSYYRIRLGDYRLGLELESDQILVFLRCMHRRDVYKKFP